MEKIIFIVRETHRKYKHSRAMGFLYISCEVLIPTISKTWEKRHPIVREKYRKIATFQK